MVQSVSESPSFLEVNNIPLYVQTLGFSIHPSMSRWVASIFWPFEPAAVNAAVPASESLLSLLVVIPRSRIGGS